MVYEVRVTPELVTQWVKTGAVISVRCVEGLPKHVQFTACTWRMGFDGVEYVRLLFEDADQFGSGWTVVKPVYERVEPLQPKVG